MTGRRSHGRDVTVARRVSRVTTMVIVLGIAIAGIVGSPAGASVSRTSLSRIDSRTAPKTSKKKNKKKNKKVASEAALRQTIRAHGLTAAGAKQLFALDIGPLPGVSVAGIKRDDGNFDGTTAVGYVYA